MDKADKCYNKMLVAAGKPTHNRSAKGICLLPINRRLNMHEDKQQYEPGDVFCHSHILCAKQRCTNTTNTALEV